MKISRTRAEMLGDYSSLKGWEWSPFGMGSGWRRVWKQTSKKLPKPAAQGGGDEPPPPEKLPEKKDSPRDKWEKVIEDVVFTEPEMLPPPRYGTCSRCCISVDVAAFEGRCSVCGRSLSFW